jgi:hypothetical protein
MLWGFGGGFVAALAIRFLGQSVFRLLDIPKKTLIRQVVSEFW